jgi:hypothetical protein
MVGIYPYGGTRHSVFLVLFATAGISFLLGQLIGKKTWSVVVGIIMVVVLVAGYLHLTPPGQPIGMENQQRKLMSQAVDYIRQSVAPGWFIFGDYQTTLMLSYYLGTGQMISVDEPQSPREFREYSFGGYRVVLAERWHFDGENFCPEFSRMSRAYGFKVGEMVWVAAMGWGDNLYNILAKRSPQLHLLGRMFGEHLAIFQVPVGSVPLTGSLDRRLDGIDQAGLYGAMCKEH